MATLLGIVGALAWPTGLLLFAAVWLLLFVALRWVSVASIAATWAMPLLAWFHLGSAHLAGAFGLAAVVVTLRHASNLRRLCSGEEPRFGSKASPVVEEES